MGSTGGNGAPSTPSPAAPGGGGGGTGTGTTEQYCLRWNDFQSNVTSAFSDIRDDKDLLDVSLVFSEGQVAHAHKLVLSACSPLFKTMLKKLSSHPQPVIFLHGVRFEDMTAILNFMYHGEVNVNQEDLQTFLAAAEELRVRGLSDRTGGGGGLDNDAGSSPAHPRSVGATPSTSNNAKRPRYSEGGDTPLAASSFAEHAGSFKRRRDSNHSTPLRAKSPSSLQQCRSSDAGAGDRVPGEGGSSAGGKNSIMVTPDMPPGADYHDNSSSQSDHGYGDVSVTMGGGGGDFGGGATGNYLFDSGMNLYHHQRRGSRGMMSEDGSPSESQGGGGGGAFTLAAAAAAAAAAGRGNPSSVAAAALWYSTLDQQQQQQQQQQQHHLQYQHEQEQKLHLQYQQQQQHEQQSPASVRLSCPYCRKELKNSHSLNVHISRYHSESGENSIEVICPVCQRKYGNKYSLRTHMHLNHKDQVHLLGGTRRSARGTGAKAERTAPGTVKTEEPSLTASDDVTIAAESMEEIEEEEAAAESLLY